MVKVVNTIGYKMFFDMAHFQAWLQKKLNENDWNQSDLARATGLTRSAISHILSSRSKTPDRETLVKIAKALRLPIEEVLRAVGTLPQKPDADAVTEAIIGEVEKMKPSERKRALETLRLWNKMAEQTARERDL